MNIFITDASFDFSTKTSIIGIKNLSNGNVYQYVYKEAKNPFEAEKYGIEQILLIALKEELKNVLIICDNKGVVVHSKRDFFKDEALRSRFNFIQFVWLPREYTYIADELSKNVSGQVKDDVLDAKSEQINTDKETLSNKYITHHVNDIVPTNNETSNTLEKRINQFILLTGLFKFESKLFTSLADISYDEMEDCIIDEIELIEKDIDSLDDDILKLIGKSIIDLLIIS